MKRGKYQQNYYLNLAYYIYEGQSIENVSLELKWFWKGSTSKVGTRRLAHRDIKRPLVLNKSIMELNANQCRWICIYAVSSPDTKVISSRLEDNGKDNGSIVLTLW